jgi:hypothetical protein
MGIKKMGANRDGPLKKSKTVLSINIEDYCKRTVQG